MRLGKRWLAVLCDRCGRLIVKRVSLVEKFDKLVTLLRGALKSLITALGDVWFMLITLDVIARNTGL